MRGGLSITKRRTAGRQAVSPSQWKDCRVRGGLSITKRRTAGREGVSPSQWKDCRERGVSPLQREGLQGEGVSPLQRGGQQPVSPREAWIQTITQADTNRTAGRQGVSAPQEKLFLSSTTWPIGGDTAHDLPLQKWERGQDGRGDDEDRGQRGLGPDGDRLRQHRGKVGKRSCGRRRREWRGMRR